MSRTGEVSRDAIRMTVTTVATAVVVLVSFSAAARADHVEPATAKKMSFSLVNSFFPCDPSNTQTLAPNSASACAPTVTQEPCAFTANGSGKLSIMVVGKPDDGTQGLKIVASAKGLNQLCEGRQLAVSLSFRFTANDCPEGACTSYDIQNMKQLFSPNFCTVTNGVCKINATVLTSDLAGVFRNGKNTGIELHGCGLAEDFPLGARSAVTCGILLR